MVVEPPSRMSGRRISTHFKFISLRNKYLVDVEPSSVSLCRLPGDSFYFVFFSTLMWLLGEQLTVSSLQSYEYYLDGDNMFSP